MLDLAMAELETCRSGLPTPKEGVVTRLGTSISRSRDNLDIDHHRYRLGGSNRYMTKIDISTVSRQYIGGVPCIDLYIVSQCSHDAQLPNLRRTPINDRRRQHATPRLIYEAIHPTVQSGNLVLCGTVCLAQAAQLTCV